MTHAHPDSARLGRLLRWLRVERWGGPAYLAGMWLPVGPLTAVLALAAAVFTPVLVRDLWGLRRWGWLGAFAVAVGGALALTSLLPEEWGVVRWGLVLLTYYGYTWVLGLAVAEWAREADESARWRREKAEWDAERDAELAGLQG